MTKILDWKKSDDPRDIVHLAVQALAEGHVVALPSSCSYLLVASGLQVGAVNEIRELTSLASHAGLSLMVRSADETLDYFPEIGPAARRFAKKAWPSPIMLSLQDSHASSVLRCLDPQIGEALAKNSDRISVWQPHNEVLDHVCRLSSGPLIACQATNQRGQIAETAADLVAGQCVVAVDDGPVEFPGNPTIVQIDNNIGRILKLGLVDEHTLRTISQWVVLFVCTGNTCRSPMAQAMMLRKITERFSGISVHGEISVVALSAGVSAFGGDPASHGAAAAIRGFGASLDHHQSTQLNSNLVDQADLILAMGTRHRHVIVSQWPNVAHKVHLIAPNGSEIADPYGGPLEVYQKCAQQLDDHTSYWIDQLDTKAIIQWQ